MKYELHLGSLLDMLKGIPDNQFDSIVTDPPYGIAFMASHWDYQVPTVEEWRECLRVLKPGGYLLSFAGTRTQHRMAVNIEDAGFEIRDMIAWVYGSGFPKSLNVSKAIDKDAGAERDVVGRYQPPGMDKPWNLQNAKDERTVPLSASTRNNLDITAPATDAAKQWDGWGTALKPALEPITLARKPLIGTVAANVQQHGTGAINVDGCRVGYEASGNVASNPSLRQSVKGGNGGNIFSTEKESREMEPHIAGRWPANLIHDGSDEVLLCLPCEAGAAAPVHTRNGDKFRNAYGAFAGNVDEQGSTFHGDSGSAARFFYCPKASKEDRDEGMMLEQAQIMAVSNQAKAELARGNMHEGKSGMNTAKLRKNHHPTVKPTDLMRYLCRLVTPPGGTVLDTFMGSGSTGKAAMREGFSFVGIEREAEYHAIAQIRVAQAAREMRQQGLFE